MNTTPISTDDLPQVTLRALEPEDLDLLYRIENDRTLWHVGITNTPYSRFALHEYLANATGDIYTDRQLRLVIENAGGEVVGMIDLANFSPQHNRAEVGLVIQQHYRDRGYGRAALLQIIDYVRRVLSMHQLYAFIDVENEGCLRAFTEVGFRDAGVLNDWLQESGKYHDVRLMRFFL
jgi:diamine N-acetyltransferase